MAYFNYRNLDSTEFEALAKDVMERRLGYRLFRYGQGKDNGIDLCDNIQEKHIVVQCKKYQQGSFDSLYSILKKEEKPKVDKMDPRPERYYVFTSLELLPRQKLKILKLFQEYMEGESNIVDGIAICEFFRDEQNHDLISRNIKLFQSFPDNYQKSTDKDPGESLYWKLRARLESERDAHPSFRLMNESYGLDRELLPKGNLLIPVLGRKAEMDEEGDESGTSSPRMLAEYIQESWCASNRKHVTIEGEGGIGKTVALLSLALEPECFPKDVPVIYVPLHRLNRMNYDPGAGKGRLDWFIWSCLKDECRCTDQEVDSFFKRCGQKADEWPRVVLLLDGYNEVLDELKRQVRTEINEWGMRPGVQIITTSRTPWSCGDGFMIIRLRPLDKDTIREYLERTGAQVPGPGDSLWRVIDYPLMLTLYTHISAVQKQAGEGLIAGPVDGTLDMRDVFWQPTNRAGNIIWNYLQKELVRCAGELDVRTEASVMEDCAIAILHTAPYIAWRMAQNEAFSLPMEEDDEGTEEALSSFPCLVRKSLSCLSDAKVWPYQLKRIIKEKDRRRWIRLARDSDSEELFDRAERIERLLLNAVSLFRLREEAGINSSEAGRSSETVEMMHQQFRDGLAAIWLVTRADNINLEKPPMESEYALPKAWRENINYHTLRFTAEMLQEESVQKIWEAGRVYQPEHMSYAYTMLNLMKERSKNNWIDLREKNLEGMDFSIISLSKTVLAGMTLEGAKFSDASFLSDFNNKIQVTLENGTTYLITSDSEELYIELKKNASPQNRIIEILGRVNNRTNICRYGKAVYLDSNDYLYPLESLVSKNVKIDLLHGSYDRCYDFDFSYDGKYIWGRYDDEIIRIWNIKTGHCVNVLRIPKLSTMCIHTLDNTIYADTNGNIVCGNMNGSFSIMYHDVKLKCSQIKWSNDHNLFFVASNMGIYTCDPFSKTCVLCCPCTYPTFNVTKDFLICYNNLNGFYGGYKEGLRGNILTVYKLGSAVKLLDISLYGFQDEDIFSPNQGEMRYSYAPSETSNYFKWFIGSNHKIGKIWCSTDNNSVWYQYDWGNEIIVDEKVEENWKSVNDAPNLTSLEFVLKGSNRHFLAKYNLFACLNEGKITVVKGNKINQAYVRSEDDEFVALNLNVIETDFRNSHLNCTETIKSLLKMNGALL